MAAQTARTRVDFYLGACLAVVCAGMVVLNVCRADYILAGAIAALLLSVGADLQAAYRGRTLPIPIPAILIGLGAVILFSVWRLGPQLGFYVFPTLIGGYLAMPGRGALWYSIMLIAGVTAVLMAIGADTALVLRLGFALLICVVFLSYAAKRIVEARDSLEDSAFLDPLTGCFNRRHLARVAQSQDLSKAALILFDLDYFKSVNDTYGHPTGDFVLRAVTSLVRQFLGPEDLFFRIGGEEFMVLRLRSEEGSTRALAEKCRAALDDSQILSSRRVTATFSCAEFDGRTEIEPVLGQADVALLQAKRAGRNRVV